VSESDRSVLDSLTSELRRVGGLNFSDDMLEESYLKKINLSNHMRQRISCVVGIFVLLLFMPQDLKAFPEESKGYYLLIRAGICIPFLIVGFIVSFVDNMKYQLHNWVSLALMILGLGSVAIVVINYHFDHISPYEGILLVIIASYFMVGLDFRSASVVSGTVAFSYILSVLFFYNDEAFATYNISFVISTCLICAAGAYELEKHLRINFINNNILKHISERDGLTNVLNRKAFDKSLARLLRHSSRERYQVLLMLVDVDYFKNYNDHYGHVAGDECLVKIASSLSKCCRRAMDIVARYGGEEFVICWLVKNPHAPEKMIDIVQESVRNLAIPHQESGCSHQLTVSGGLYCIEYDAQESMQACIEKADKALYDAKALGRNRIVQYRESLNEARDS